jgi:hypothetical protein
LPDIFKLDRTCCTVRTLLRAMGAVKTSVDYRPSAATGVEVAEDQSNVLVLQPRRIATEVKKRDPSSDRIRVRLAG